MFSGIQEDIFEDPEFKEDSVRELIIAPILSKLGYKPSGPAKVTRSKVLRHPFIQVGKKKHPVTTVPDYTISINENPFFVLDAKSPSESVQKPDHIQQAYSYAIHPEIGCKEFGLCNGRELIIFDTSQRKPLLQLEFKQFEPQWEKIEKQLLPKYLLEPEFRNFKPDFGTALYRLGIDRNTDLVMQGVRLNFFGRVNNELITASGNCDMGFGIHCVSFDFSPDILKKIVAGLPITLSEQFIGALNKAPFTAAAGLVIEVDLTAVIGEEMQGQHGKFMPLVIKNVHKSRFDPINAPEDPNEYPSSVFVLKNAFKIRSVNSNS